MSVTHPPVVSIVPDAAEAPEDTHAGTREVSPPAPVRRSRVERSPAIRWSEVPVRVVLGFDDDSEPCQVRLEFFDGDRKTMPLDGTLDGVGRRLLSAFQRKIDETGHVHPW